MSFRQYPQQGLMPAIGGTAYVKQPVNLPWGGQAGSGIAFDQGSALINIGGAAQAEIWTFDTTGTPGTFRVVIATPIAVYRTAALAYNVSAADLKTALEGIFGVGSIATVTGTAGTQYVITFTTETRYGCGVTFTNTFGSGSISFTRTQAGSSGTGQYDVYAGSGKVKAFLEYEYANGPQGDRGTEFGNTGQPFSPSAYTGGYFLAADTSLLDATAMTQGNLIYEVGTGLTDPGAIVHLL